MASLIGQVLAVLAAIAILRALLRWTGTELGLPRAAALTAVTVLGFLAVGTFRESWHMLDGQRSRHREITAAEARANCVGSVRLDGAALAGVAARVPEGERYYVHVPGRLPNNGGLCLRFSLLPRVEVARPEQARYVVFWQTVPSPLLDRLRQAGATVRQVQPGYAVARLP